MSAYLKTFHGDIESGLATFRGNNQGVKAYKLMLQLGVSAPQDVDIGSLRFQILSYWNRNTGTLCLSLVSESDSESTLKTTKKLKSVSKSKLI